MKEYIASVDGEIFKSGSYSDLILQLWDNSNGEASIDVMIKSSIQHLQNISRDRIIKKAVVFYTENFRKNLRIGNIAYFKSNALGVIHGNVTRITPNGVSIKCSEKISLLVDVNLIYPEKTISL